MLNMYLNNSRASYGSSNLLGFSFIRSYSLLMKHAPRILYSQEKT